MLHRLLFAMPLLWAAPAAAQLELGGSTRVRYETIDGQARADAYSRWLDAVGRVRTN